MCPELAGCRESIPVCELMLRPTAVTRVAAADSSDSEKPDLGSPGDAASFALAGIPFRGWYLMNPRLQKRVHDVLPLPAAVRPLTGFGRSSEFRRSSKSCQRPDSAATEIPHTPCRSPKPAAIGLTSRIAEAADFRCCTPLNPLRTAALPQPIDAGSGRSWPVGADQGEAANRRRRPFSDIRD